MSRRPRPFTPLQHTVLGLLAAGSCALFGALGALMAQSWLVPRPLLVAALASRPPATATRTPSATPLPSATPTETATSTASPTDTATVTETPTPTDTHTPTATYTPTPTVTPTPLWPTPARSPWPSATLALTPERVAPTLDDFWDGRAAWSLELFDVGLPMGESDTVIGPDGQLWSYLHASWDARGILDQWAAPVPFPGCVTLWQSADRGRTFHMFAPRCLIQCKGKPCGAGPDDIDQQQYPRVAQAGSGLWVMVYEWRAQIYLRTSDDGLNWSLSRRVPGSGAWAESTRACQPWERIGTHPFVAPRDDHGCLAGAPPGLFIDGEQMYVFAGMGKNPGHMGCFTGPVAEGVEGLRPCAANPLFGGAQSYGPVEIIGAEANPYFDFRTVSSAELVKVGERYYMAYEGVRGPEPDAIGDTQFNLGFARSLGPALDGPWEKYPGNPVLMDVPGNVGIGHADLLVLDGITYLYTATGEKTRGRYALVWR
jgi:hypothetical protein